MKYVSVSILSIFIAVCAVYAKPGDSLLTPTAFPKTTEDMTFKQRMDVMTAGYEPFESEFDSSGKCIRGCPYAGFTIDDQIAQDIRNEQISQRLLTENNNRPNDTGDEVAPSPDGAPNSPEPPQPPQQQQPQPQQPQPPQQQQPQPQQPQQWPSLPQQPLAPVEDSNLRQCSVFLSENRPGQQGPRGEPLANCPRITSKYGMRIHPVTRKKNKHHAVDLYATEGTNVYATGDGTVFHVENNPSVNPCGKYVKIRHTNGMISVYCHLSKILVRNGEKIQSGCLIAKSGSTGRVTGPHLHYSVRLSDNSSVDPEKWMTCRHKH